MKNLLLLSALSMVLFIPHSFGQNEPTFEETVSWLEDNWGRNDAYRNDRISFELKENNEISIFNGNQGTRGYIYIVKLVDLDPNSIKISSRTCLQFSTVDGKKSIQEINKFWEGDSFYTDHENYISQTGCWESREHAEKVAKALKHLVNLVHAEENRMSWFDN